jgi:hypothetical protein
VTSALRAERAPCAELGIIVAPGVAEEVTARIVEELLGELSKRYDSVDWQGFVEIDRLVRPPAALTEILEAARRRLLEAGWDIAVVVTDLPLKLGGRPVTRHLSPTHRVAVLSLPALGPMHVSRRLRRALAELIGELARAEAESSWEDAVLRELARDGGIDPTGHLRLLLGMLRANRPWRLATRLYGALVAAAAVAAFGVLTFDIWVISFAVGWWRLAALCVGSLSVTALAVISAHGLWERAPDPRVRGQVVLFNLTTTLTVAIGIATLYCVLFLLVLGVEGLTIRPSVFARTVGDPVGFTDYVALAWFVASLGTIAGGLGAGLESREAMREAAYASTADDERLTEEVLS